jgi:hypothetical protein
MNQMNHIKKMTQIEREMVNYNKKSLELKVKNINDNKKYHKLVEKIISYTKIPQDLYKYIKLYIGYRPINIYCYFDKKYQIHSMQEHPMHQMHQMQQIQSQDQIE